MLIVLAIYSYMVQKGHVITSDLSDPETHLIPFRSSQYVHNEPHCLTPVSVTLGDHSSVPFPVTDTWLRALSVQKDVINHI